MKNGMEHLTACFELFVSALASSILALFVLTDYVLATARTAGEFAIALSRDVRSLRWDHDHGHTFALTFRHGEQAVVTLLREEALLDCESSVCIFATLPLLD